MTDLFVKFFQNPLFLIVILAVLIPVIIEWLLRRRRRRIKFAAMRFLLDSERPKKIRMQDRVLLFLRMLIIFLVVLALARPLIRPEDIVSVSRKDKKVVILFDATYSNARRVGNVSAFSQAQRMANEVLAGLPEGVQIIVGVQGSKLKVLQDWTTDKGLLRDRIDSLTVSHGSGAMREGLQWALDAVTAKSGAGKLIKSEVYIFSDLQAQTWTKGDDTAAGGVSAHALVPKLAQQAQVFVADTGGKGSPNIYLTSFEPVDKVLAVGVKTQFKIQIKTANMADSETLPARLTLMVNNDKRHAENILIPGIGLTTNIPYTVLTEGEQVIRVLLEGDDSPLDNERLYLVQVPRAMRVLILDDQGTAPANQRPTVFWEYAVAPPAVPGKDPVTSFVVKTCTWEDAQKENFSDFGAVLIGNLKDLPQGLVSRIMFYVREGGCLMTFGGEAVEPYAYEQLYKQGEGPMPMVFKDKQEVKGFMKSLIPNSGNLDAGALRYYRSFGLGDKGATNVLTAPTTLGQLSSGQPLVVMRQYGQGRSVAIALDAGIKWSNLPLVIDYPVFVQELLRFVLGDPNRAVNLNVGEVFSVPVLISSQHLLVKKPNGEKTRITPDQVKGEELPRVSFSDTDVNGLYEIDAPVGVLAKNHFVVNLNPDESDMKKLSALDLSNQYSKKLAFLSPDENITKRITSMHALREFAGMILFLIFLCLLAESFLAMRFGLRKG